LVHPESRPTPGRDAPKPVWLWENGRPGWHQAGRGIAVVSRQSAPSGLSFLDPLLQYRTHGSFPDTMGLGDLPRATGGGVVPV
jgi:hypothetical protein